MIMTQKNLEKKKKNGDLSKDRDYFMSNKFLWSGLAILFGVPIWLPAYAFLFTHLGAALLIIGAAILLFS